MFIYILLEKVIIANMNISYNKNGGGVIRWDGDDWLKGLIPQFSTSGFSRMTAAKGFTNTVAIDPLRFPGYLAPGKNTTVYTNNSVIDATLVGGVNNGSTAYVLGGAKLHSVNLTNNTITSPAFHTITGTGAHSGHTTFVGSDTILYYVGTVKYLFFSYNDATDGDIGRFDLSSTFVDNYLSGTAASGAVLTNNPHPLVVGTDDVLYIGNGNILSGFNGQSGATGTYIASKLVLPKDYIITSFSKVGNFLVIYAYKNTIGGSFYSGESTAFFWDYLKADPTYAIPLQGSYVTGGFNYQGVAGCFVQGGSTNLDNSKSSRLMLYDGVGFKPVTQFPENIPAHNGVFVTDNVIYWNAAGVIYRYGSPHIGFPEALNKISLIGNSSGLLRNFVSNQITGSGSASLVFLDDGFNASSEFYTPFVTLQCPEEMRAKVRAVKVYWYGIPESNCNSFTLRLRTGVSNTETILDTKTSISTTPIGSGISEIFRLSSTNTPLPFFEFINVYGSWTAGSSATALPLIPEAIEVYFEFTKI